MANWEVHPGIQGGPRSSLRSLANRFDCAHSSLVGGSFDAEMIELERVLQKEDT